ncbi:MAG: metal ABC transporter permease [Clostridia bacterium]|nr:metal ABC transporter permease [Clostridia bacterium]
MFQYDFMLRALVGGLLVSLCAALLGVSLVLKRYSMIGDGLSHVGFGALAIASAANFAPLEFAIPIVVISAFFLLRISENSKIKGDAAIALISTSALAIGITAATVSTGMNTDINSYLFGSILSISDNDVVLCSVLFATVLVMFILFYNKIFAVTFDENFARATGTKAGIYNMIIALLTALTIVVGMKMMGSLLISSLIIFPAITSMRVFKSFRTVIISAAAVSAVSFVIGLMISYHFSTPAGSSIVIVNLCVFIVFTVAGKISERINAKNEIR